MSAASVVLIMLLSNVESLQAAAHRAVTLEPHERRLFRVPGLKHVTASSGRCIEEGLSDDDDETVFFESSCGGVRTMLVWRADGVRVQVLACAEDEKRPAPLVALRKTIQAELKGSKTTTACVRNGRVELWGWVETKEVLRRYAALEAKYGLDRVFNGVELMADTD